MSAKKEIKTTKKTAAKAKDLKPKKNAKGGGLKTMNHHETLIADAV